MKRVTKRFAVCLDNEGNESSLIPGKVYRVIPDARAAKDSLVRVIDESGEDYLFSRDRFVLVDFPESARKKLLALQRASCGAGAFPDRQRDRCGARLRPCGTAKRA